MKFTAEFLIALSDPELARRKSTLSRPKINFTRDFRQLYQTVIPRVCRIYKITVERDSKTLE